MAEKTIAVAVSDISVKPPISPKPIQERKISNPLPLFERERKFELQEQLINRLLAESEKKDIMLAQMEARLRKVEGEQVIVQSILCIKDTVASLLSKRITQLEQYSRRYSVIVKGIPIDQNERFGGLREKVAKLVDESQAEISFDDVDKFHRNGPRIDGKQDVIVRFKSHSAKEEFFFKRKSIPEAARVKIQPSLTPAAKKLLGAANEEINFFKRGDLENSPDFALPDVHGNLLLKFSKPTTDGLFVRFDSLNQMHSLIQKYNSRREADEVFEEMMFANGEEEDGDVEVVV